MTPTEKGMQLAEECAHKLATPANWHALRAHLQAMEDAAQTPQPAQAAAWMTEDGERVIPVHTKAQAIKDGGATKSATDVYSVPLFRQPAPAGAVEPVLYQWCSDGLWINLGCEKNLEAMRNAGYEVRALYAHPPKAGEAVALTDAQIVHEMRRAGMRFETHNLMSNPIQVKRECYGLEQQLIAGVRAILAMEAARQGGKAP